MPEGKGKLEVCVAESETLDGKAAAEELIAKIKDSVPHPKFILLFTTIHYKDHFKPLLSTIKSAFPDSPLIGGTVAGFITRKNCYVKGAAAFALYHPEMDVAVGVGHHTKAFPKRAAKQCAKMIKEGLQESKYRNRLLIDVISGPKIPKLPFKGRMNVVDNRIIGNILTDIGIPLFSLLGYGFGREEEVIKHIFDELGNYNIIGISATDDSSCFENYQFLDDNFFHKSIVSFGISMDMQIELNGFTYGHSIGQNINIKTKNGGYVISSINDRPAKNELFRMLNITKNQIGNLNAFYYRLSDYFPISYTDKRSFVTGIGGLYGDNIILGYKAQDNKVNILTTSGMELINKIEEYLNAYKNGNIPFFLFFSSFITLNILGNRIYRIKDIIETKTGNIPYLVVYSLNENISKNKQVLSRVYSFNGLTFINEEN